MAEWASQFEGEHGATELVGLAVDSNGDVALAGHVFEDGGSFIDGRKDAIVMKLASSDGSTLWTRNIGVKGSHDWSSAVAADRAGNIFVGGQTDGSLFADAEGAGQDIWVAKLDGSGGELVWGYQVGSRGQDVASALTVDGGVNGNSDVVVCGSTTGGLFEQPDFPKEAPSGGGAEGTGERGTEAFCAKFAGSDGHVMWGTRIKGGFNDGLLAAAVDPKTGDIFATGYTEATGGSDYLVVRLSGWDGSERWRSTGGGGWTTVGFADSHVHDSACTLAVDGSGDIVIAGNTEGALFGDTAAGEETDAFVAKLDGANGTRLWGWQGGSAGNDYANAVALDPIGDVYACGSAPQGMFGGDEGAAATAPLGAGQGGAEEGVVGGRLWDDEDDMAAAGYGRGRGGEGTVADMFVAKLNGQTGALVWGEQFGSGADDEAVGLVLGPDASAGAVGANEATGALDERATGGGNALYLTGWTRGALFSSVPARWQDGWAVKLPNPPPKTLGVSSSKEENAMPFSATGKSGAAGVQQAAAERGAITAGLVGTVTGMLVVVSLGLYFVLRKASHAGGSLSTSRYDSAKDSDPTNGLFRRRGRPALHETGGKGAGGGGGKGQDSVELTLLSDGGDGGRLSPPNTKRETSPPPVGVQQPTFYL